MFTNRAMEYYITAIITLRNGVKKYDVEEKIMSIFNKQGLEGLDNDILSKVKLSIEELKIVEKSLEIQERTKN